MNDQTNHRVGGCREGGFTLIEMMITLALAGIFFAAITSAFIAQNKGYQVRDEITDMMQGARVAMDMMTREMRMASSFSFPNQSYKNQDGSYSKVIFQADVNGPTNGVLVPETIVYDLYDSTLLGGVKAIGRKRGTETKQPLALNASSLSFTMYSDPLDLSQQATNEADVVLIEINLTVRTANKDEGYSLNNGYRTYTLTSFVSPRNLAFN
ncbi:MAG: hypothetical protein COX57_13365 [Alphaproteobacteria bacterium CG_4_10_14_0_2_um_filter_63_37]|nr:MAG: hypothetical protein AUJ55_12670 [Proteobacteria bacterium CG1_02_64_396]PJA23474.1 MAG: hypothetical protein COX57_13365 [Alphaproteobacteria bacterium CG_4_10_14_0_2_um_filter_63_37]